VIDGLRLCCGRHPIRAYPHHYESKGRVRVRFGPAPRIFRPRLNTARRPPRFRRVSTARPAQRPYACSSQSRSRGPLKGNTPLLNGRPAENRRDRVRRSSSSSPKIAPLRDDCGNAADRRADGRAGLLLRATSPPKNGNQRPSAVMTRWRIAKLEARRRPALRLPLTMSPTRTALPTGRCPLSARTRRCPTPARKMAGTPIVSTTINPKTIAHMTYSMFGRVSGAPLAVGRQPLLGEFCPRATTKRRTTPAPPFNHGTPAIAPSFTSAAATAANQGTAHHHGHSHLLFRR